MNEVIDVIGEAKDRQRKERNRNRGQCSDVYIEKKCEHCSGDVIIKKGSYTCIECGVVGGRALEVDETPFHGDISSSRNSSYTFNGDIVTLRMSDGMKEIQRLAVEAAGSDIILNRDVQTAICHRYQEFTHGQVHESSIQGSLHVAFAYWIAVEMNHVVLMSRFGQLSSKALQLVQSSTTMKKPYPTMAYMVGLYCFSWVNNLTQDATILEQIRRTILNMVNLVGFRGGHIKNLASGLLWVVYDHMIQSVHPYTSSIPRLTQMEFSHQILRDMVHPSMFSSKSIIVEKALNRVQLDQFPQATELFCSLVRRTKLLLEADNRPLKKKKGNLSN